VPTRRERELELKEAEETVSHLEKLAEETRRARCVRCSLAAVNHVDGQDLATFQFEGAYADKDRKQGYSVTTGVHHLIHDGRSIPDHPLDVADKKELYFDESFFDGVAEACGMTFAGIFAPLDGSAPPEVVHTAPIGLGALEHWHCVWQMPQGHCWEMSIECLLQADLAELAQNKLRGGRGSTYEDLSDICGYFCLGDVEDEALQDFRRNRGTLAEERWSTLPRTVPRSHLSPCVWIRNYGSDDKTQGPVILERSFACLSFDLHFNEAPRNFPLIYHYLNNS